MIISIISYAVLLGCIFSYKIPHILTRSSGELNPKKSLKLTFNGNFRKICLEYEVTYKYIDNVYMDNAQHTGKNV